MLQLREKNAHAIGPISPERHRSFILCLGSKTIKRDVKHFIDHTRSIGKCGVNA